MENGITTYTTPQGATVIRDTLLHRQVIVRREELQYTRGHYNPLEYAAQSLLAERRHITGLIYRLIRADAYTGGFCPRYDKIALLGDYAGRILHLAGQLDSAFEGIISYWDCHGRRGTDKWRDSAGHVFCNAGITYTQYKIRAEVSGWSVYPQEDFVLVRDLFDRVREVIDLTGA